MPVSVLILNAFADRNAFTAAILPPTGMDWLLKNFAMMPLATAVYALEDLKDGLGSFDPDKPMLVMPLFENAQA